MRAFIDRPQAPVLVFLIAVLCWVGCESRVPSPPDGVGSEHGESKPQLLGFEATAYTIEGKTAAGTRTRDGIVAADPRILPLGTRIRVHHAGRYSGVYVVTDTGRTIKGREIDIYIRDNKEARQFGRKRVKVELLERGHGRPRHPASSMPGA